MCSTTGLQSTLQFVHHGFLAGHPLQNGQGYLSPRRASCRPGATAEPGMPLRGGRRHGSRRRAAAGAAGSPAPGAFPSALCCGELL